MRSATLFLHDLRFQLRHGFYGAYLFVCAAYLLILHSLPAAWAPVLTVIFIFTDTSVLGAIFSGGIVLLERNQGVHHWIAVSPAGGDIYLGAHTASLTLLALLASTLLLLGSPAELPNPGLALLAVVAGSVEFTCLGLILGFRSSSMLGFFAATIPASLPAVLPLVAYPYPGTLPLLPLLPNGGAYLLLRAAFEPLPALLIAAALFSALLWSAAAVLLCRRFYRRYIRIGGGEVA